MGDTDQRYWAHCLALPQAIAKFPTSWRSEVIQETFWRWLQVGKLEAVAERIVHPGGAVEVYAGIPSAGWDHPQPPADSAFWTTGDFDLVRELPYDRYDELEDGWAPGRTETTRLIGVRIEQISIPFAEKADDETKQPLPKRGRKPATWWPAFAEELAAYVHEQGLPPGTGADGQGDVIEAVLQALSDRGFDASRTTIQPVVQALLNRLRAAGK